MTMEVALAFIFDFNVQLGYTDKKISLDVNAVMKDILGPLAKHFPGQ